MFSDPNEVFTPSQTAEDAFMKAVDDLSDGDFDPIPKGVYNFKIAQYKLESTDRDGNPREKCRVRIGFQVNEDDDGYAGRYVWDNMPLEGTYPSKNGGVFSVFEVGILRLCKAILANYPDAKGDLFPLPHTDPDTLIGMISYNDDDERDLTEWEDWFERIKDYDFNAFVDVKPKRTYDEAKGKWRNMTKDDPEYAVDNEINWRKAV